MRLTHQPFTKWSISENVGAVPKLALLLAAILVCGRANADATQDKAGVEFFETKIRPLLAEECLSCHSVKSKPVQSELALDERAAILRGGSRGVAIVPGHPEKSLLISALRGRNGAPDMPPRGRLSEQKIALVEEWIRRGAPWPAATGSAHATPKAAFNLQDRKSKHWVWKPISHPTVPLVKNRAWVKNPIDAFILSGLEAHSLTPAPSADRRTLIRRATYDLIGLPPTTAEVDAFLNDTAPGAYERVVDRLLASPHYGERWGRHWLDLVRYAETYGHEGDYDKPGAYQYRDYVIRALNADVPYNQFVQEHVAGDLLPNPRHNPAQGFNESILGTGFWWLGEGTHSPVDLLQDEADRLDNQIDVFGKAFLGLTMGCARCHDHKFDAISTRDYYAIAGFLRSSRYQLTSIESPQQMQTTIDSLDRLANEREELLRRALPAPSAHAAPIVPPGATLFEDFSQKSYAGWTATGQAFGSGPRQGALRAVPTAASFRVEELANSGVANSGYVSDHLHGVLRSRTFTIKNRHILYHVAGSGTEIRLIVSGLQLIQDPIYGGLRISLNGSDALHWVSQDVSKWIGYRAYIELVDNGPGHLLADRILFSDGDAPSEAGARLASFEESRKLSSEAVADLRAMDARRLDLEKSLSDPPRGLAMADGTGENDRVHIRGSYKSLGVEVPRRFLEALGSPALARSDAGSGRLALAKAMVAPTQTPLVPRVIVNRLWLHHFGEGIVRTPDDFGVMGQKPTHPELLDWLADNFISANEPPSNAKVKAGAASALNPYACNWSLKKLHRLMVLSNTYRMASKIEPKSEQSDPTNRFVHRMPVRRLEAEAIRDAVLAVSGRLDTTLYGPSVMPYLSPYMEGRGRPGTSGPLDGAGRRSVYINIRRNFIPLFLLAFDYPVPFTCIGRRSTSNVPAQALAMMNNPFILEQSEVWAKRITGDKQSSTEERVRQMYLTAFSRPPDHAELMQASAFLAQQPGGAGALESWTDLCHVLFNIKEFMFLN